MDVLKNVNIPDHLDNSLVSNLLHMGYRMVGDFIRLVEYLTLLHLPGLTGHLPPDMYRWQATAIWWTRSPQLQTCIWNIVEVVSVLGGDSAVAVETEPR